MTRWLAFLLALLLPATVDARGPREMREIEAGQPVSLRADRAYILFRTLRPEGVPSIEPVLMRIPNAAEMERYAAARRAAFVEAEPGLIREREAQLRKKAEAEAAGKTFSGRVPPPPSLETFNFRYDEVSNVQEIDDSQAYVKGRPESVYLVEVVPGDYVLYGASFGSGMMKRLLSACMCLGTVGFAAPAGSVTDLGYFMADMAHKLSDIPELRAETGLGPSSMAFNPPLAATIRPARPDSTMPAALAALPIRAAEYRAIGRFVDHRALTINRLVPVPGILAYEGRRVIDVRTGADAATPQ